MICKAWKCWSHSITCLLLLGLPLLMMAQSPKTDPDAATTVIEASAVDGRPLYRLSDAPSAAALKDSLLTIAKQNYDQDPRALENVIWYGRRLAYLTRYGEAIAVYTEGLRHHPQAPELFRHRGHRYLSTRQFRLAVKDFRKAARLAKGRPVEIEPDGIPNRLNKPLSSLQFNIYYHLALAYYLQGNFKKAIRSYKDCLRYSSKPDLLVATSDWLYMAYRRSGQEEEANRLLAGVSDDLEIIENDSYFKRLQFYKGQLKEADLLATTGTQAEQSLALATQGYGLANWYLCEGEPQKTRELLNKVIDTGYWPAFGYLAAEVDLHRMR